MSSSNDRAVLNCIFNPLIPTGEAVYDNEDLTNIEPDEVIITEEVTRAKELEIKGIEAAEKGQVDEAVKIFTEALSLAKTASGYNNRAQAYRLLGNDEEAMKDLNASLDLSQGQRRSGCQALCQRGLLHRRNRNDAEAKLDFGRAAYLGSKFAKHQLIEMNPYAAMCNQMLSEMLSKANNPEIRNGC